MLGSDTQALSKSSESKVFLCGLVGKRAEKLLCEHSEFFWSSFMIGVETRENEEQDKFVFLVVRNRHEATAPVLRDGEDMCVRAALFLKLRTVQKTTKTTKTVRYELKGRVVPSSLPLPLALPPSPLLFTVVVGTDR